MKRCHACGEKFENQYAFCPIDGNPLQALDLAGSREYRPTLISTDPLPQRLITEVRFVVDQVRRAWPRFKADPFTFFRTEIRNLGAILKRGISRPHALPGGLLAAGVVIAVVLTVLVLDKRSKPLATGRESDELLRTISIDLRTDAASDSKSGVGAGQKGSVGFEAGRGKGSGAAARSHGGGGGNLAQTPPSQGRLPQPSEIPAPIPTTYARLPPQALPAAGIDLDPVLWKSLPFPNYGDPRSKAATPSNGPGEGGGVGDGKGTGIGEGSNNGFGPGRNGNIGGDDNSRGCCGKGGSSGSNPGNDLDRVYKVSEVTVRARLLSKPEPQYTEEARRKQITGTVILSVVFSRDGQVMNIRAVQTLCCGLTEKAIAAARQIRFVPATRNGQAVPTFMQLEYNFNLY